MTQEERMRKYNIPVPRYTSYPPANYFREDINVTDYAQLLQRSNAETPSHISFYFHIPFCRHLCHYCGCNSYPMANPEQLKQYIHALHREIDLVTANLDTTRKVSQIHYGGGSPTILPGEILKELNDHLLSSFGTIENSEIAIECHPGYLKEEDWFSLLAAGFNRFSLGVQDLNEEVLKVVNRRPSLVPLQTIFSILRESKADINLDLLYGLPLQTVESFTRTVREAVALRPDRLVTFSYGHVPWVNPRQRILEKRGFPAAEVKRGMYEAAGELFMQNGYHMIGLDHFVREGDELHKAQKSHTLHRNFQGYCTRRTTGQVYAFGATAISQLQSGFSQNTKDIRQYITAIEKGEFAVSRGYQLTMEEQINGAVIETLMCNYSVVWKEIADRFNRSPEEIRNITAYDVDQLDVLAADGIIRYDPQRIDILPEGYLFVRNVAALLDPLMRHSSKTYSKPV